MDVMCGDFAKPGLAARLWPCGTRAGLRGGAGGGALRAGSAQSAAWQQTAQEASTNFNKAEQAATYCFALLTIVEPC